MIRAIYQNTQHKITALTTSAAPALQQAYVVTRKDKFASQLEPEFQIWTALLERAKVFTTYASAEQAIRAAGIRARIVVRTANSSATAPITPAKAKKAEDLVGKTNIPISYLPPAPTESDNRTNSNSEPRYNPDIPAWMRDFTIFQPFTENDPHDPGPLPLEF